MSRNGIITLIVLIFTMALGGNGSAASVPPDDPKSFDTYSLAKRHRLEFRVGYWGSGQMQSTTSANPVLVNSSVEDIMGAFSYAYWAQENLATDITFRGLVALSSSTAGYATVSDRTVVISSALFGIRYYPIATPRTPLRPYFAVSAGPYIGVESTKEVGFGVTTNTTTLGTFGGYLGGGLDLQMGRHFMVGFSMGYHLMADFSEPLAGEDNYSGIELGAGISLLLGKGEQP